MSSRARTWRTKVAADRAKHGDEQREADSAGLQPLAREEIVGVGHLLVGEFAHDLLGLDPAPEPIALPDAVADPSVYLVPQADARIGL